MTINTKSHPAIKQPQTPLEKAHQLTATHIKSAIIAAVVTFLLTLPILGVRLTLVQGKLEISGSVDHALIATLIVFITRLCWPLLATILQKANALPVTSTVKQITVTTQNKLAEKKVWVYLAILVIAITLPFFMSRGMIDAFTLAIIYILLGLGLNVVVGFAGLLDLGYVGFYAVGAYTYAMLNQFYGLGFWTALPIAGVLAGLTGLILGFPVLRLRGDYLAIVTLGFGEIIRILLNNLDSLSGGPNGIGSIDKPTLFGLTFNKRAPEGQQTFHDFFGISFQSEYRVIFLYLIGLLFVVITLLIINRLSKMPIGRAWEALREDEIACKSLGLNPTNIKLSAFTIGAIFAGIAGAFFASKQGFINPESFTFIESAIILAIVVLGGMGSQIGVMLAAIALTLLPEFARSFEEFRMLIFGLVMILMMIWRPQGLIPAKRPIIQLK